MLDPREREIVEQGYASLESSFVHWLEVYVESYGGDFSRAVKSLNMMHMLGDAMEDTIQIMNGTMGRIPMSAHMPKHSEDWKVAEGESNPNYASRKTKPHEG